MTTLPNTPKNNLLLDLFTTALEGGINYWSDCTEYRWSDDNGDEDLLGFRAVIEEYHDGTERFIDRAVIRRGVILAAKPDVYNALPGVYNLKDTAYAYRYGGERLDNLDYDATTADAIVQLGLFGKVIYG